MLNLCMCHLMIEVLVGHLPTPLSMKCVQPFCGPLVLSLGGFRYLIMYVRMSIYLLSFWPHLKLYNLL